MPPLIIGIVVSLSMERHGNGDKRQINQVCAASSPHRPHRLATLHHRLHKTNDLVSHYRLKSGAASPQYGASSPALVMSPARPTP